MHPIEAKDNANYKREIFTGEGLPYLAATVLGLIFLLFVFRVGFVNRFVLAPLVLAVGVGFACMKAKQAAHRKRFAHARFRHLWEVATDRRQRLQEAVRGVREAKIAQLSEVVSTMESVYQSLYRSLRHADIVLEEIAKTEKGMHEVPLSRSQAGPGDRDPDLQDLFQLADKNVSEYRHRMHGLQKDVRRTEAQAEVFITTLDSLRVQMLGLRLSDAQSAMNQGAFVRALSDAREQLHEVERALNDLDFARTAAQHELDLDSLMQGSQQPPPLPQDARVHERSDDSR